MHDLDALLRTFGQHFDDLGGRYAADNVVNRIRDVSDGRIRSEAEDLRPSTSYWVYSPSIAVVHQMVHV